MTEHGLIDDYLTELAAALELPRGRRARVLAEAADHLLCAAEQHREAGASGAEAQRAAIRSFGPAPVVALSHVRATAVHAARRLAPGVAATLVSFAALVGVAQQRPALASSLAGAIAIFGVQIAAVCGVLTVLRVLRHRGDGDVAAGKLRLIEHGALAAVAGIAAGLVAICVAVLAGTGAGALLVVLLALCAVTTIGLAAQTATASRRIAALARQTDEPASDDLWDDIAAFAARLPTADLRRHPWRVAGATALAAGLAAAVGHLVAEGPPTGGAGDLVAVTAILVAIEGAAVLGCFALLGRFLGIRSPA